MVSVVLTRRIKLARKSKRDFRTTGFMQDDMWYANLLLIPIGPALLVDLLRREQWPAAFARRATSLIRADASRHIGPEGT